MLAEVFARRGDADLWPILVYGRDWDHAAALARSFVGLARAQGATVAIMTNGTVLLDGVDRVEFRGMEEDSPRGQLYADIFIDNGVGERVWREEDPCE